ncbi:hypothetical protein IJG95_01075 [Candidatus Saccharibacteria bacterium]|nr:hypothetical protein [Candidatus Saccharibacteria bacterium]
MIEHVENPGVEAFSPAERVGELLADQFKKNPYFYFFSPDETTSNRFDAIYGVEKRAWGDLKRETWDLPSASDGRIIEMLSENVLFSTMTGHLMAGEQAMMGSYEAFYPIITSQILQHLKFVKQSREVTWREELPAVNLLSTSTCWRQDHNGYTHQSPALISTLLTLPTNLCNCLFPVDDVAAETAFDFMLKSRDVVNLTTFNKTEVPRYIDSKHAEFQYENGGASVYEFASDENPDFVLTAAGDIQTHETLEAMKILRKDLPGIKLRFVGITALSYRAIGTTTNKLSKSKFEELFTADRPIIANFHGYPETLAAIFENYTARGRVRVHGFNEEGSTTTPFEMLRMNAASRYDIAADVAKVLGRTKLVAKYYDLLNENHNTAVKFGEDLIK